MAVLGLDFGTSNTGAAVMAGDRPFSIPLEPGAETIPTAVFVDFGARRYLYGTEAARAMMRGEEGRFLRALKSVLGTPLMHEKRAFLNERLTLVEIVGRFLSEIRSRAETFTGMRFDAALSGRPVRFHPDPARDAAAEADLAQAYALAGFSSVEFLPEPEAAALAVGGTGRLLIVDIGGGTSDFTLCDRDGSGTRILASGGRRIGGTDFDRVLSLGHAMPYLGYESRIGAVLGAASHAAPRALYHDLASWEKIPFVYDAALLREVRRWVRLAEEPRLFERLATVLEMHLGHDVAYAVESGKIGANDSGTGRIGLDVVEKGLSASLVRDSLDVALQAHADEIGVCALETVAEAGVCADSVERVVFVGGSSLMGVVRTAIGARFPKARQEDAAVFTAVMHGLARATERPLATGAARR